MSEQGFAIEIRNLTKNYGKHRGVKDISFNVSRGDIFGFLGPNGAGKSTTIRCMLGMLRFSGKSAGAGRLCPGTAYVSGSGRRTADGRESVFREGSIRLLGMDAASQNREILRHVGYMPSEAMFYPSMKVKEIIRFAAQARKMDCGREAERICRMLEVDQEKRIGELSLGNRKKVSIVCAMQHQPELLILDEPTSGLDPLMQEAFFQLLLEYNARGTTCFLSSHVLPEVKRYCRNAAIIREGELVRVDSVENLLESGIRRVKVWKAGEEQVFSYSGDMRELIKRLDEMQVDDVLIEEPSLEELFMHYYKEGGRENDAV